MHPLLFQQCFDGHQLLILHFIPFPVDQPQVAVQPFQADIVQFPGHGADLCRCFFRAGNAQAMKARIRLQMNSHLQVLLCADSFHKLQIFRRGSC